MNAKLPPTSASETHRAGNAMALALRLAHAENALHMITSGQIDAIVNVDGQTYLMRPAQEQLRQQQAHLNALIASVADVLTVVNRQGFIVSESFSVRRVFGYTCEELVGTSFFNLIHKEDAPYLLAAFQDIVEGIAENTTICFRHQVCNGTYRKIEATLGMLRDDLSGKVVFCLRPDTVSPPDWVEPETVAPVSVQTPLTDDRFIAQLADDLRDALTPILHFVGLLQHQSVSAEAQTTLAIIGRNLGMQAHLLDKLGGPAAIGMPPESGKTSTHPP